MDVVIGANGYMGSYIIKNLLENTGNEVLAVCRSAHQPGADGRVRWAVCDISDWESVKEFNRRYLLGNSENRLFYLAAYHHPDLVEKNPRIAWDVNITALSRFLNAAENVSEFYYPSTDSVYGDSIDGHTFVEEDDLRPVNRYGVHKCVAEKLVTAYGYHVVRFPFLISPSLVSGKPHFFDTVANTIKAGKPFDMFSDSFRSAISFDQAAAYMIKLMGMGSQVPQIVNVCSDRGYSKYEVGLMIADKVGASRDLIRPISISDSKGIFEAKRATSTLMNNERLKAIVGEEKIELKL